MKNTIDGYKPVIVDPVGEYVGLAKTLGVELVSHNKLGSGMISSMIIPDKQLFLGTSGTACKVHNFAYELFEPLKMPTYTKIVKSKSGVEMIDFYNKNNFNEHITECNICNEYEIPLNQLKDKLVNNIEYWCTRIDSNHINVKESKAS